MRGGRREARGRFGARDRRLRGLVLTAVVQRPARGRQRLLARGCEPAVGRPAPASAGSVAPPSRAAEPAPSPAPSPSPSARRPSPRPSPRRTPRPAKERPLPAGYTWRGSSKHKWIVLTFDEDVRPGMYATRDKTRWYDPRIIDLLESTGTPATIFLNGLFAKAYPQGPATPGRDAEHRARQPQLGPPGLDRHLRTQRSTHQAAHDQAPGGHRHGAHREAPDGRHAAVLPLPERLPHDRRRAPGPLARGGVHRLVLRLRRRARLLLGPPGPERPADLRPGDDRGHPPRRTAVSRRGVRGAQAAHPVVEAARLARGDGGHACWAHRPATEWLATIRATVPMLGSA